jgi:hypothetical protein
MPEPLHDPCRWNSRAGFYLFGQTPVVADPRQTGAFDTALINTHEQSHNDLITNTAYGYVLHRLYELDVPPGPTKRRRDRLRASLSAKLWTCAEGSATAAEWIAASSPLSGTTTAALAKGLTPDYQQALAQFQPICDYAVPFPPPFDFLARGFLLHAASECAADLALFQAPAPPQDFWALADLFENATVPDELLPNLISNAAHIPIPLYAFLLDQQKQLQHTDLGSLSRGAVAGLKSMLCVGQGIPEMPPLLEDAARTTYIAALVSTFPSLPKIDWLPGHISTDPKVQVETQEPPFLLADEEVPPVQVVDRMFQLSQAPGFQLFVVLFLRELPAETYSLIVHPMAITDKGLDMASPYLISKAVPPAFLKIIDSLPIQLVFETTILQSGGQIFYDPQMISLLNRPVYLQLREFSWSLALQIAAPFPGETQLVSYKLPPDIALTVSAIHKDRFTIFGITPLQFMPNQPFSELDLGTSLAMAAVAMVLLRQSKASTI